MTLTLAHIRALSPKADPAWAAALVATWPAIVATAGLSTPTRARHFLAQTAEESGGFRVFQENLNYSAKRLTEVWPDRFKTLAAAKPFANNPALLAEKVYGGRRDLGNTQPGDGWKFHGMGPIQSTGRAWAEKMAKATGLDLVAHPEQMLEPKTGWLVAAHIWAQSGANAFVDRSDFEGETRRINGGLTNLAERRRYLALANKLPDSIVAPAAAAKRVAFADLPPDEPEDNDAAGEAAPPEPAPPEPPIPPVLLQATKERFRALGYFTVGIPDEDPGPKTVAATSQFQAVAGLPVTGRLDPGTMDRLWAEDAPAAPISEARGTTSRKDLAAAGNAVVLASQKGKLAAIWSGLAAGVVSAYSAVREAFGDVWSGMEPIRSALGDVPGWIWGGAAIGIAWFVYQQHRTAETAEVSAVRTGQKL